MQWFANFIIVLDGKFDGSQKLHLANYTRYMVSGCQMPHPQLSNSIVNNQWMKVKRFCLNVAWFDFAYYRRVKLLGVAIYFVIKIPIW